jgi:hypothetical protein
MGRLWSLWVFGLEYKMSKCTGNWSRMCERDGSRVRQPRYLGKSANQGSKKLGGKLGVDLLN